VGKEDDIEESFFEEVSNQGGQLFPVAGATYSALSTQDRHSNVTVWVDTHGDTGHYGSIVNIYPRQLIGRGPVVGTLTLSSTPSVAAVPQILNVDGVAADGYDVEIIPGGTPTTKTTVTAIAHGWESAGAGAAVAFTKTGFPLVVDGVEQTSVVNSAQTIDLRLVNGDNTDITIPATFDAFPGENVLLIFNPTAPFSIGGIAPPPLATAPQEGYKVTLINFDSGAAYGLFGTGQAMTVKHQDPGEATPANRIVCFNGADAVFGAPPAGGFTVVRLVYSNSGPFVGFGNGRWIMMS
jgi:hypothetical protein